MLHQPPSTDYLPENHNKVVLSPAFSKPVTIYSSQATCIPTPQIHFNIMSTHQLGLLLLITISLYVNIWILFQYRMITYGNTSTDYNNMGYPKHKRKGKQCIT